MKPTLKHLPLLLIACFTIWACTKKVETIISIDYEINEDFESEGFVNSPLSTTVNIVPIQVLEGFDYFVKYEVVSGNGFYSSGSGIIAPNEFMPLSGLSFSGNYIPETSGEHKVKFTIRDEVGLEESTTLTYSISNLDLNWVATTNASEAGIGQEFPITLTLANNTEGSIATFTRTIRLTSGTAIVSDSNGAVALNSKAGITPGAYNFTAVASETGTLTIEFELEDNSGQTKTTRVSIDITEEPVNQSPTAVATSNVTNGTAPLTVQFDGSGSTDPEESTLTYSWNLTNESGTFNETLTGVSPTYEFATPGTYTATLTVTDTEDATGTDTIEITVSESDNAAPTASASADVVSGPAPLTVNFDGSDSSDEDGTISGYSWDFGDGGSGSGTTPSHEFTDPGTYTVTLTVTDDGNATGTDTIEITVSESDNTAPTASASADVVSGPAPLTVNFDGSGSMDSDGTIPSYSWELSNGVTLSGMSPEEYTFNTPGEYTATLTVTDNDGVTATDRIDITVSEPPNEAPTASASADVVSGLAPLTVNFDGSGSMDSDGTIASYSWELSNGFTLSGMSPEEYTFNTPGDYTATLTVTDNDGETATDRIDITVSEPEPENTAPVANDDSATIIEGETLTMNVLANDTDADGDVLSIDMSNSSTINGTTVDNGNNTITYTPSPDDFRGTAIFEYTVTDGNGGTDTAVLTITVEPNDAPVANASAGINLSTATFSSAGTSDDRGIENLTYLWNFGDGNTSTLANPIHTYSSVRTYNVTLTVTDEQGKTGVDNISVTTRYTSFNSRTGVYTAPAGSTIRFELSGDDGSDSGGYAEVYLYVDDSHGCYWRPGDTNDSVTCDRSMPSDSNINIEATFETTPGTGSYCRVVITHVTSGERREFILNSIEPNFPSQ